jgi:hypothetical protein
LLFFFQLFLMRATHPHLLVPFFVFWWWTQKVKKKKMEKGRKLCVSILFPVRRDSSRCSALYIWWIVGIRAAIVSVSPQPTPPLSSSSSSFFSSFFQSIVFPFSKWSSNSFENIFFNSSFCCGLNK